jgi:uncharacterized membrane protein HdeD (DUF308 family)
MERSICDVQIDIHLVDPAWRETAGTRALFILGGLVSVAFGVVLFARPGIGAVTLALLFGLFSLIYGISQITLGAQLRHTGKTLHSVLNDAA